MDHGVEVVEVLAEDVEFCGGDEEVEQQSQPLAVPVIDAAAGIDAVHRLADDLELLGCEGAPEQCEIEYTPITGCWAIESSKVP